MLGATYKPGSGGNSMVKHVIHNIDHRPLMPSMIRVSSTYLHQRSQREKEKSINPADNLNTVDVTGRFSFVIEFRFVIVDPG